MLEPGQCLNFFGRYATSVFAKGFDVTGGLKTN
jgi:hypothetical protein